MSLFSCSLGLLKGGEVKRQKIHTIVVHRRRFLHQGNFFVVNWKKYGTSKVCLKHKMSSPCPEVVHF